MSVRIWVSDIERTEDLVLEGLPEWIETSAKGAGFFEWEARSVSFRLHSRSGTYDVGDPVRVSVDGTTRMTGMISKVRDPLGSAPEYEVSPYGRHFKDVKVGNLEPDEAGRMRYVFELENADIREAAIAALANWGPNKPAHFPGAIFTVNAPGNFEDPVGAWAPHGLTAPDDGESGWLGSPSSNWTSGGLTAPTYHFGLRVHSGDVYLGLRHVEYLGGGQFINNWWTYVFEDGVYENGARGPVQVGLDVFSTWENALGHTSERVETLNARQYVAHTLNVPLTRVHLIGAVDMNTGSWLFCGINPSGSDVQPVAYAVWWADPTTQRVTGRWLNKSIADILKLLALVSMRWLNVTDEQVMLVPRTTFTESVVLPAYGDALQEVEIEDGHTSVPGISIQLQPTDDTVDEPEGMANFTEGRVAALQWVYSGQFDGVHRTVEAEHSIDDLPSGMELLAGSEGEGVVTRLAWSTDGRRWRYRVVRETT